MKIFSALVIFALFGVIYAHKNCDCDDCPRRKIKVCDDFDPEIKVVYSGTPCECQKALPFRVEVPKVHKQKLLKHKYDIEIKEEKKIPECRYVYDTKVEKPIVEKLKLGKYPVKIEKLRKECKKDPRFIYSVKVEKPKKVCGTQLEGLVAKVDTIVMPAKDCPQPCCKPEPESCEVCQKPVIKCCCKQVKTCKESSEEIAVKDSSEECHKSSEESSEEIIKCTKRKNCKCLKCNQSSEELPHESSSAESSEEIIKCTKRKNCKCLKCNHSSEEVSHESSSEEIIKCNNHKKCYQSSEELSLASKSSCEESSEEIIKCTKVKNCECKKCFDSSEEISSASKSCSEEIYKKPVKKNCECNIFKKIYPDHSSEEIKEKPCCKPKKCESSEEIQTSESSEEKCKCGNPRKFFIKTRQSFRPKLTCGCH